jgi:hypothetical protein
MQALGDRCMVIDVLDRFGDYGLTGVIAYGVRVYAPNLVNKQ